MDVASVTAALDAWSLDEGQKMNFCALSYFS